MSAILQVVAKRALRDVAQKNINSRDPYFEEVAVYDRQGRPTGKVKKQKKGIPAGLSQKDAHILKRIRKRAYHLDMSLFNCCGMRFGWSSVIGFIPVIGDVIDMCLAWLLVRSCCAVEGGLPPAIMYRMYFNVLVDFGIGLVPFVGDVADALFRANTRNAWILEEYLIKKAEAQRNGELDGKSHALDNAKPIDGPRPSTRKTDGVSAGSDAAKSSTRYAQEPGGGGSVDGPAVPPKSKSFVSHNREPMEDPYYYDQEMGIVGGRSGVRHSDRRW